MTKAKNVGDKFTMVKSASKIPLSYLPLSSGAFNALMKNNLESVADIVLNYDSLDDFYDKAYDFRKNYIHELKSIFDEYDFCEAWFI